MIHVLRYKRAALPPLLTICILVAFSILLDFAYATSRQTASTVGQPPPGDNASILFSEAGSSSQPNAHLNSTEPTYSVFDVTSFWYEPIPTDAPLHPNSANFVIDFLRQMKSFYGSVGINTNPYSSPIYIVGADTATVSVAQWDCQNRGYRDKQLDQQWLEVPIPPYAEPSDGTDSEMTIYQPSTDTMWEFWKARNSGGQWQACWGGRMLSVSKNKGIWQHPYGTTATGLPFLGGLITVDELRRGTINHAIGIALVETENWNVFSWPANRSDGYNPLHLPNRIPEGLRFRLDPSVDINAIKLHPLAKIIARAAQIYGFVVWDKGGAVTLRAENPKRFTVIGQPNPYIELWNGTPSYRILAGFPWDRLQFLQMNYGRP
jgi:hypothetical protein